MDVPMQALYPSWSPEAAAETIGRLDPRDTNEAQEAVILDFHSWLVRVGGLTVLIDTCAGDDKVRPHYPAFQELRLPFLERLDAAGVRPEDVDHVLFTHLHVDHSGWNTHHRRQPLGPHLPQRPLPLACAGGEALRQPGQPHRGQPRQPRRVGGQHRARGGGRSRRRCVGRERIDAGWLLVHPPRRATASATCRSCCATAARRRSSGATSPTTRSSCTAPTGHRLLRVPRAGRALTAVGPRTRGGFRSARLRDALPSPSAGRLTCSHDGYRWCYADAAEGAV